MQKAFLVEKKKDEKVFNKIIFLRRVGVKKQIMIIIVLPEYPGVFSLHEISKR